LLLNGDLTVHSRPGKGTIVHVEIPLGEDDETATSFIS